MFRFLSPIISVISCGLASFEASPYQPTVSTFQEALFKRRLIVPAFGDLSGFVDSHLLKNLPRILGAKEAHQFHAWPAAQQSLGRPLVRPIFKSDLPRTALVPMLFPQPHLITAAHLLTTSQPSLNPIIGQATTVRPKNNPAAQSTTAHLSGRKTAGTFSTASIRKQRVTQLPIGIVVGPAGKVAKGPNQNTGTKATRSPRRNSTKVFFSTASPTAYSATRARSTGWTAITTLLPQTTVRSTSASLAIDSTSLISPTTTKASTIGNNPELTSELFLAQSTPIIPISTSFSVGLFSSTTVLPDHTSARLEASSPSLLAQPLEVAGSATQAVSSSSTRVPGGETTAYGSTGTHVFITAYPPAWSTTGTDGVNRGSSTQQRATELLERSTQTSTVSPGGMTSTTDGESTSLSTRQYPPSSLVWQTSDFPSTTTSSLSVELPYITNSQANFSTTFMAKETMTTPALQMQLATTSASTGQLAATSEQPSSTMYTATKPLTQDTFSPSTSASLLTLPETQANSFLSTTVSWLKSSTETPYLATGINHYSTSTVTPIRGDQTTSIANQPQMTDTVSNSVTTNYPFPIQ